jgi:galactokinase
MAVDRDVVMAVACTDEDTKVRVANINSKYPAREFDYEGVDKIVTIDSSSLEWSNYFKCGYKVRHFLSVSVYPSVISWSLKQVIIKGYA